MFTFKEQKYETNEGKKEVRLIACLVNWPIMQPYTLLDRYDFFLKKTKKKTRRTYFYEKNSWSDKNNNRVQK